RKEYDFSKGKRGAVIPLTPNQERLSICLDIDIINYFKENVHNSGGGNYQILINNALHEYIEQQKESLVQLLEVTLRRVIREEFPLESMPVHQYNDKII
ncbi:MAG: hypothetical protein KAH77_11540, partial [Thiomargarita sp.]|nr:hypothetical protein [Thiomargarita sp.]